MLTSQRKKLILEKLALSGQVQSRQLSEDFGVSEDTVRRDLRELAAEGQLQRVHGGALPASAATATFGERKTLQLDSKRAVARKGASLIEAGQVVIIDGGTTTSEMIACMPRDRAFTVITHSPGIAVGLADYPLIEVIMIGGRLYKHSLVAVGASTIEAMANMRADIFFMGVTGVHAEAGLSTGDYEESSVKRALAARAAETIVLASAEKINRASAWVIGDIALVNTLVVEASTDDAELERFAAKGVVIIKA